MKQGRSVTSNIFEDLRTFYRISRSLTFIVCVIIIGLRRNLVTEKVFAFYYSPYLGIQAQVRIETRLEARLEMVHALWFVI